MFGLVLIGAALAAAPLAATPVAPALTVDQETALRCSASFAIVAAEQSRGTKWALVFAPLQLRGKEFFVRAAARLMDETGLGRTEVQALVQRQALALRSEMARSSDPGAVFAGTMPLCLDLLETTIPAVAGRAPKAVSMPDGLAQPLA